MLLNFTASEISCLHTHFLTYLTELRIFWAILMFSEISLLEALLTMSANSRFKYVLLRPHGLGLFFYWMRFFSWLCTFNIASVTSSNTWSLNTKKDWGATFGLWKCRWSSAVAFWSAQATAASDASGSCIWIGECEYSGTQLCYVISYRHPHMNSGIGCICLFSVAGYSGGTFTIANSVVHS